jgi:hypothetical protein
MVSLFETDLGVVDALLEVLQAALVEHKALEVAAHVLQSISQEDAIMLTVQFIHNISPFPAAQDQIADLNILELLYLKITAGFDAPEWERWTYV